MSRLYRVPAAQRNDCWVSDLELALTGRCDASRHPTFALQLGRLEMRS